MGKYKAKLITDTKVRTGMCRLSYPHLFERYGESGKYQCVLLIDKSNKDTLSVVKRAIENAKEQGKQEKWKGKIPGNYKSPLHDGDDVSERAGYEGCFYLSAKNGNRRPQVVDLDMEEIVDAEDVYAGCYVRASITFFPYNTNGNGVGVVLNHIQKIAEGESLGGDISTADDDFGDDEDEDDDLLG